MKVKKIFKNKKGAVMPLVAIILGLFALGFLALIIDLGDVYIQRKRMITAADAAALAGAQVLKASKGTDVGLAKTTAEKYAKDNGAIQVQIPDIPTLNPTTRQVVDVTVGIDEPSIFARFLGSDSTNIKAHAIATWGYVKKSSYFPIFVFDKAFDNYSKNKEVISLHDNVTIDGSKTNSFSFVEVNDSNAMSLIKEAIEGTIFVDEVKIGDILGGVPGKRESVYDSARKRIGDIVLIPVIDSAAFSTNSVNEDKNSNSWELKISYFAYFKITDVLKQNVDATKQNGNGNDKQDSVLIKGYFTGDKSVSNIIVQDGDQTNPNPTGDTPALYCKLIK